MKRILVVALLLLHLVRASDPPAQQRDRLDGFSASSQLRQLQIEKQLTGSLKPQNAEAHLKWLTSRPHRAGTEGARLTAEYINQKLSEYGFASEIVTYSGFLPEPISVSVELLEPDREVIPTTETRIDEDPFTNHVEEHPGWNAYSPSGEAIGLVVYAHHGSEEDFRQLESMGIDLKGKIVLLRYFGTGEGTKVKNAERVGASGVVLYSDPKEDGYRYGDVYPKGNWRPAGGIMRRSIIPLWYDGDPLSPGWASVEGAKRLRPEEIALPKIPVLPVSYESAQKLLKHLSGPMAPHHMQGDLPLPYRLGPGPAKLRIATQMDNRDRPMRNVIARLEGGQNPDQWIILGNHHDAWIFGAGDPSSGTASLLEFARGLGGLIKQGFRPKRTLILAFWDAEEMLLGGSTEWVEHHKQELLEKAVACINMDSSVFNTERPLSVSAHPVLHRLFREVSRNITDPKTRKSLFESWRDLQNAYRQTPSVDGWGYFFDPDRELKEPWMFEAPSDDAAPFFHQLALPASDMYYGADYGMYHSIYENFHWMKTVVDPTFEYHILMALLQGFVALRLANADFLPLDYSGEAAYWKMACQRLQEGNGDPEIQLPMRKEMLALIDTWDVEAKSLRDEQLQWLSDASEKQLSGAKLAGFNRKLFHAARDFYRENGRPGAELERNLWAGSDGLLPGITGALSRKDAAALQKEAALYRAAIQKRIKSLQSLRKNLRYLK